MRPEFVAGYGNLERQHFWHLARRQICLRVLEKFVPRHAGRTPQLLDVGCGAGTNLSYLKEKQFDCVGIEPDAALVSQARATSGVPVWQDQLPLRASMDKQFDIVLLLDVLEHIEDDRAALLSLKRFMRAGSILLLNVPAHPRLWSSLDEVNQHRRRYTRASLHAVLVEAGYVVRYLRFWGSLGCPLLFLQRRLFWLRRSASYEAYLPPPLVNAVLRWFLWWEFLMTEHIKLPFGVSLFAVAQKP